MEEGDAVSKPLDGRHCSVRHNRPFRAYFASNRRIGSDPRILTPHYDTNDLVLKQNSDKEMHNLKAEYSVRFSSQHMAFDRSNRVSFDERMHDLANSKGNMPTC